MLTKFLSIITFGGLLYLYILSQLNGNDILFYISSPNTILNLALLCLAGLAVFMSFTDKFSHGLTFILTVAMAAAFLVTGVSGIVYTGLNSLLVVLEPLDAIVFMELGIIYGILCLTRRHTSVSWRLPNYNHHSKRYVLDGLIPAAKPQLRPR